MTDNNQKLDIAQRIAEAMQRTTEPKLTTNGEINPEQDTVVGEVPEHLRHLHNLVDEIGDEAIAAERHALELANLHKTVKSVFFDSLEMHVPTRTDEMDFDAVKLCTGWKVAGVKQGDDDGEMGGLGELLAMAAMGGRR